jgi:hypothetical protein
MLLCCAAVCWVAPDVASARPVCLGCAMINFVNSFGTATVSLLFILFPFSFMQATTLLPSFIPLEKIEQYHDTTSRALFSNDKHRQIRRRQHMLHPTLLSRRGYSIEAPPPILVAGPCRSYWQGGPRRNAAQRAAADSATQTLVVPVMQCLNNA